ncbi:hypothetical protein BU23DRAFT_558037 [Bimuria novae-zelandiae CBS 107.79]|uniref:Uncharacterized protein n=1 Tax=Bimuria novae-zelandiae CBS 107.79 TaxID=1447943 RepID=A0A6A5UUZ6_9PLEO|nr:hypothetical protein BU23DRAFT_558037 [Bimuria novae-zelandiae CBS 107.79]
MPRQLLLVLRRARPSCRSHCLTWVGITCKCPLSMEDAERRLFWNFGHSFMLGVGPEGMCMWQSFKSMGPRLHDHISLGGAKVRDWREADKYVGVFDKFVSPSKKYNSTKNEQYRKLFGVSCLGIIASPEMKANRMVPQFELWVEIRTVESVQAGDVLKFDWSVDANSVMAGPARRVTMTWR